MITRIDELKRLSKHILWKFKCKFDCKKCDSNEKWNNNECQCEYKNPRKYHACEKNYIWNSSTCTSENGKYSKIIIGDREITLDKIIEATKIIARKTIAYKNLFVLLAFLLIIISLF